MNRNIEVETLVSSKGNGAIRVGMAVGVLVVMLLSVFA